MELKRITDSRHPEVEKIIALHREIFPEYPRYTDTPLLAKMIDDEPSVHFHAVYENDLLAGYFIYWDLDDCYYVHFIGIYPEMRNQKTGQRILDWISASLHHPVFLEAEIPHDDITARRLDFYKRNGFMELAKDPAILALERDGGHPLWFMGTQAVADLAPYLEKVLDRVYGATVE